MSTPPRQIRITRLLRLTDNGKWEPENRYRVDAGDEGKPWDTYAGYMSTEQVATFLNGLDAKPIPGALWTTKPTT